MGYRRAACLLLFLLAAAGLPGAAQQAAPGEREVPNFWDPGQRMERPLAGAIQGIRFVTTDDFPPFNFLDQGGRLTGFNIDLARAICDELDVRCTIQARPFDDLVPSLAEKRSDAAIAGIAVTGDLRGRIAFTEAYLRSPARFAVRKGLALAISPVTLAGRTAAVMEGSAHEAFLETFFPGTVVKPYPNAAAARAALRSGAADVLFGDGIQLAFWLQGVTAGGCCSFAGGPYLDSRYFGEGYRIAVRPEDGTLRDALEAALAALHAKGVFGELYLRYFPIGFF